MRKNAKNALLLATAILGLGVFCFLKLLPPRSGFIGLRLESYTNASAVVTVENRSLYNFDYVVLAERKIGGKWPDYIGTGIPMPSNQAGTLRPGRSRLTVPVMVYVPPYPWRISVFCYRPYVQPNELRLSADFWFTKLGIPNLSRKLWGRDSRLKQVSTAEMEQWQK